jgi:vancomycin resistance protein YoaR
MNLMPKRVLFILAGLLMLASGGMLGGYFVYAGKASAGAVPRANPEHVALPVGDPAAAATELTPGEIERVLDTPVELRLRVRAARRTWRELGAQPATGEAAGSIAVDPARAVPALIALKAEIDSPPMNARMDLEKREVIPEQVGYGLDVYGSLAVLEAGVRERAAAVELPGAPLVPPVTIQSLGGLDISQVMGKFTTKFTVAEKARNYNLKLAASKLNGYVLMPGQELSFNDVVGDRTEKEGYKIAPVITAGELVDGLAGGTCQISTTLHGASFFAGLDLTKSLPHSRPSAYVAMGLDATVVYGVTDMKIRNPYDFPVVIHYRVARGEAYVEILGKGRPYDKIAFEREVEKEIPFETVTREDSTLPVGSMVVEQEGFPGYELKRYRKFYKGKKVVKTDEWKLRYRPVTEFIRMGINPDPNLPPPEEPKGHHSPKLVKEAVFRMVQ